MAREVDPRNPDVTPARPSVVAVRDPNNRHVCVSCRRPHVLAPRLRALIQLCHADRLWPKADVEHSQPRCLLLTQRRGCQCSLPPRPTKVRQFLFDGDLLGKVIVARMPSPGAPAHVEIGRYVLAQRMKNERAEFAWDWHRFTLG